MSVHDPKVRPSTRILESSGTPRVLRVTDQETARVVAVHRVTGELVGAGCLIDSNHILTCRHVVAAALAPEGAAEGKSVLVSLAGVTGQPTVLTQILTLGGVGTENDIAALTITNCPRLNIPPVEFASPLRHGGKSYSTLGFPGGDQQGRNVSGRLHASDAKGLVQMDRGGALSVLGGFSGAPVWSPDLNAFVGIVVTELSNNGVSWCIPSRRLCEFYPDLRVRFRIPPADRPKIHDIDQDDPNVDLFGTVADNGDRRLLGKIKKKAGVYEVTLTYECIEGRIPQRGHYVTFITYPNYEKEHADAYELFAQLDQDGRAQQEFGAYSTYTVAAIGDAGDTVLTLDLEKLWSETQPKSAKRNGPKR